MANPFRTSFAASAPLPAGRDEAIESFVGALDDGPGAPGRATLYTGTRGAGKTVMLNAVEDFDPDTVQRRMTSLSAPLGVGSALWDVVDQHVAHAGLRNQIELLTDLFAEHRTGLLLTVDEVHRNQVADLREVATVVQHAFRGGRNLAFVGAGLAASASDIVNDDVLTFLPRADRHAASRCAGDHCR